MRLRTTVALLLAAGVASEPNRPDLRFVRLRGGASSQWSAGQRPYRPQGASPFMKGGDLANDQKMTDAERVFVVEQFRQPQIQKQFLKRVYAILAVQLAATTGLAITIRQNPALLLAVARNMGPLSVLSVAILFCLLLFEQARKQAPLNGILLAAFTLAQGACVGAVTTRFPAQLVLRAAGATALATGSLSTYALTTKRDFTPQGGMLSAATFSLLGLSLAQFFFGGSLLDLVRVYAGVLIFCGWLIYDTQRMMGGGKARQIRPTEPILAAIALYQDIINLFMYLLQAMARNQD